MTAIQIADLKVLIVDDHLVVLRDMDRMLKALGCKHIDQASNVNDATAKMTAARYDLVFLDWNMPGKSGYSMLQQCRALPAYDGVAFVIVSAESEDRFIIDALKAGATSYIVKPVAEPVLQEHFAKVLAWLERRAEKSRQHGG
jgi:two-component system chemotaxis response regulator CheY